MNICGLHGCVASVDAPSAGTNEKNGHKETLTSHNYNISVNYWNLILHTTSGHPTKWNDKTLNNRITIT